MQDEGFQGADPRGSLARAGAAGREVKQGKRSDCYFPSREREESSGQGEALIVLSQPAAFPAKYLREAADVSCKSATGQKHPEGRMTRCTDRDGETEEIAFSPGGLAGRGFH